ncbi:MAG: phospho-sugar mutase [Nakamurella sp.]
MTNASASPPRLTPVLRDATMRWIADDPSAADRAELQAVLAQAMAGVPAAVTDLQDRMSAPLAFGTAGLRGPLRAGPAGLNLAVVRRAAAGIAAYLRGQGQHGRTVVIGYDGRHRSAELAADAAGVVAAAGFSVLLATGPLPTPITAFAVRQLDAAAGLQVTASHNPPQDNGLKVYLAQGAQLVEPEDGRIEAAIAAARPARSIDADGAVNEWPDEIVQGYLDRAGSLARSAAPRSSVRLAITPMHGVGGETAVKALHLAGFTDVHVVEQQARPDGDFPTVPFPNPEEPGAADLLLALAERVEATIAVALDPDADRCAVGVPLPGGGWRMLSGDETGALIGDHLLRTLDRALHPDPLVATTIVSGELLKTIAAAYGARYDETLTGFKWIVRSGNGAGGGLVFGYEEALGLCVDPDRVRDKDGISAAVVAADLVSGLQSTGQTLLDRLDELARSHGLVVTGQLSLRVADLRLIADAMVRLRQRPPTSLLGDPVSEVTDLLPRTDGIRLRTTRVRVVIRPSGTEPKLKCYLQVTAPVPGGADLAELRASAAADIEALTTEVGQLIGAG